jgi:hypothetical protein
VEIINAAVEVENSDRQCAARGGSLPDDPATYALQALAPLLYQPGSLS